MYSDGWTVHGRGEHDVVLTATTVVHNLCPVVRLASVPFDFVNVNSIVFARRSLSFVNPTREAFEGGLTTERDNDSVCQILVTMYHWNKVHGYNTSTGGLNKRFFSSVRLPISFEIPFAPSLPIAPSLSP
jgi:hypothetical protein